MSEERKTKLRARITFAAAVLNESYLEVLVEAAEAFAKRCEQTARGSEGQPPKCCEE